MEAIKILRFKTGEDIICYVEKIDTKRVTVRSPMEIIFKVNRDGQEQAVLVPWLPHNLMMANEANILISDLLFEVEAHAKFIEYYEAFIGSVDIPLVSSEKPLVEQDLSGLLNILEPSNKTQH